MNITFVKFIHMGKQTFIYRLYSQKTNELSANGHALMYNNVILYAQILRDL